GELWRGTHLRDLPTRPATGAIARGGATNPANGRSGAGHWTATSANRDRRGQCRGMGEQQEAGRAHRGPGGPAGDDHREPPHGGGGTPRPSAPARVLVPVAPGGAGRCPRTR